MSLSAAIVMALAKRTPLLEETMTNDLADMRDRQDRLEERVSVLEVTVQEEAALRAKMDGDLGEMKATLNAHTRSLQALHDTQSDHTRRLTRIEDDVRGIKVDVKDLKEDVGGLKEHAGSVQEQLQDIRIGLHAIVDLLDTHLARKPWWAKRRLRLNH
jgi:chromosome segregation ATPase